MFYVGFCEIGQGMYGYCVCGWYDQYELVGDKVVVCFSFDDFFGYGFVYCFLIGRGKYVSGGIFYDLLYQYVGCVKVEYDFGVWMQYFVLLCNCFEGVGQVGGC